MNPATNDKKSPRLLWLIVVREFRYSVVKRRIGQTVRAQRPCRAG